MAQGEATSVGGEDSVDKVSAIAANNLQFPGSHLPDSNMLMGQEKRNRCGYSRWTRSRSCHAFD